MTISQAGIKLLDDAMAKRRGEGQVKTAASGPVMAVGTGSGLPAAAAAK
jgi:hypothetical protein